MTIATTPEPPYYAVIFTSIQSAETEGYAAMAEKMASLARKQPGYLGIESARQDIGITISYWQDLESIKQWKDNAEHIEAQAFGKSRWYDHYTTRIALVERDYSK